MTYPKVSFWWWGQNWVKVSFNSSLCCWLASKYLKKVWRPLYLTQKGEILPGRYTSPSSSQGMHFAFWRLSQATTASDNFGPKSSTTNFGHRRHCRNRLTTLVPWWGYVTEAGDSHPGTPAQSFLTKACHGTWQTTDQGNSAQQEGQSGNNDFQTGYQQALLQCQNGQFSMKINN